MFTQEDIAFLAAFGDAANAHDVERIVDFYAPDAVGVSPVFGEVRGRAAIAQTREQISVTMPDARLSISDVLKDDQRIALIARMSASPPVR